MSWEVILPRNLLKTDILSLLKHLEQAIAVWTVQKACIIFVRQAKYFRNEILLKYSTDMILFAIMCTSCFITL